MPGVEASVLSYRDDLAPHRSEAEIYNLSDRSKLVLTLKALSKLMAERQTVLYMQKAHFHSAAMFFLNRLGFLPDYIFDYDDYDIPLSNFFHRGIWNRLFFGTNQWDQITYRLIEHAKGCVASSHALEDFLHERHSNVCYIPTGVDVSSFSPKVYRDNQEQVTLLWNGLVWGEPIVQNLFMLLRAFEYACAEVKNIRLLLVGGGAEWETLQQKIDCEYSQLPITMRGWVEPHEMPAILHEADIGVLPLVGNDMWMRSKSPTKMFEYMAGGLPVIASAIGEAVHVIDHQHSGYLVRSENEMAEGMIRLARNAQWRRTFGESARATVEQKYSLPVLAENLYSFLRQTFPHH
jgi:glycosyltransferase involved in cell wall biosynthesis